MQEYNSPEEYIKDVQRYIRWSRAKVVATRELSDHINDQYDALRENGLNQKEAMRKAIEEMGDADVVGTELDIVHRPKVNWLLLLIAGVLLLSGILISAMLTSISLTVPKIIGIVLGVCVAAFLYFMPVDVKVMRYFYDHPITLLLYEYGKFSLVFLLFVFGILFAILYRTSKKQDTEVGKLLTNTVLLIYILRIVFTALSDIGVLPNFFMCVPFVVTGGMFIIYDMALVGIILSVNRNESIAKDWIKLKSKRNAAKNGGQL